MARGKKEIASKERFGNMGQTVVYKDGTVRTYLNPHGKGVKCAKELKDDRRYTNDFAAVKKEGLTNTERAYRSGYLTARKDEASLWKKKHPKG